MSAPLKASNPARWAILGLADPDPSGKVPKGALVADILARACVMPGSVDPIEGIIEGVSTELVTLSDLIPDRRVSDSLLMLSRRLDAASQLLRWSDNREPMPTEDDEDEPPAPSPAPTPTEPPASSEDVEVTRDAGPDEPHGVT